MRRILPALTILALVTAGCGGGSTKKPPVALSGRTNNHGTKAAKDDLEVELDDFYFAPTFITAKSGQKFSVSLKNEGDTRHTFSSPTLGIDIELAPGDSRTVSVDAPEGGFTEFHCRFHQSQGMQGAVYVG